MSVGFATDRLKAVVLMFILYGSLAPCCEEPSRGSSCASPELYLLIRNTPKLF